MQPKIVILAGFSLLCLAGSLATAAFARPTPQEPRRGIVEDMAVARPTDSVVFRNGSQVYVYDVTYRTLYHVNTDATVDKGAHAVIVTKLQ